MTTDIGWQVLFVGIAIVGLTFAWSRYHRGLKTSGEQGRDFSTEFWELVRAWGLVDKVEIRKRWDYPTHTIALFRIVWDEDERDFPLPPLFVKQVRDLVHRYYEDRTRKLLGASVQFVIESGKTWGEIKGEQESWADHCKMFWAGVD